MEDLPDSRCAQANHPDAAGVQQHGPSGAGVWLSPALDARRRVLYVGTGNGLAGMLRAYDTRTGSQVWGYDTNRDFLPCTEARAMADPFPDRARWWPTGSVFVSSGYGILGGMPGSVLLAFIPSN